MEKKQRNSKKAGIQSPKITYVEGEEEVVDILPKKVKKVSLKKTEPVVEKELESEEVSEEVFIPPPVLPVVFEEPQPVVITLVELEAKKELARQKNKEYREKNRGKIREKDKKYATENAEVIKEKRVAKLKDPEAKKAYNEQQRLYKEKARAQAKAQAGAEPKPPKVAKMTKAQQRDLILSHAELNVEQKLEELAKLIK